MWVPYSGKAQVGMNLDNMDVGSMHHLYPFDSNSFPKPQDLADDVSVQRVVTILHGNIKQWSFIESQLLEPNVNLGMPEIFIPLRHLTTTLEVLGKILFMKNDLTEAKACLERACPLMELLPSQPNDDQNHYATACFNLLREVYNNFYGPDGKGPKDKDNDPTQSIDIDMEVDIALEGSPHNLEEFEFDQNNEDDEYNISDSGRRRSRFNNSKGKIGENYNSIRDKHKQDNRDSVEPFDVEIRLEQLRSPYEHLRAELHEKETQQHIKTNQKLLGEPTTAQPTSSTTKREQSEYKNPNTRHSISNHFQHSRRKPLKLSDPDELIFPAYMYESSYDGRLLRLKTKFDNVLRRFVLEASKDSRQVVMKQAEDFLEEFYISIEDASVEAGHDLREFNEIMDLGNAFLEMLSKATIDYEFSFILEDIRTIGLDAEYMLNGDETVDHTSHLSSFDRSRAIVLKAVGRALHYMILPNETANFEQYSNGLHIPPYGHDIEASAALFDQSTSAIPSAHRSAVPTLRGDMKIATNIMLFFIFAIICMIAGNHYQSSTQRRKGRSRSKSHNKTFLDTVQALFLKQARDSDDEDSAPSRNIRRASLAKGSDKVSSNQYGPKKLVDHVVGLANIFMSSIKGGNANEKSLKQRKDSSKLSKSKKVKSVDKATNNSSKSTSKAVEPKSPSDVIDHVKSSSSEDSYEGSQSSDDINMSSDGFENLNEEDISAQAIPEVKPEAKPEVKISIPKKVEFSTEPKVPPSKVVSAPVVALKPALKQVSKPVTQTIPVPVPAPVPAPAPASISTSNNNSNISNGSSKASSNVIIKESTEETTVFKPHVPTPAIVVEEAPFTKEVENVLPVIEKPAELLPVKSFPSVETTPIFGLNVENDTVVNTEYEVFSKHDTFSILQPSANTSLPLNEEDEEDNLLYLSTQLSTDMNSKPYEGLGGFWGGLFAPAPASSIPVDSNPLGGVYDRRGLGNPASVNSGLDIPLQAGSSYMSPFDQNFQVNFMSPQMSAYADPLRMDYQQHNGLSNVGLCDPVTNLSSLSFDLMTDLSPNAPSFSPFAGLSTSNGLSNVNNLDPLLQSHSSMGLNINGLKSNTNADNMTGYFQPPPGLTAPSEISRLNNFSSSKDDQDKF